MVNKTTSDVNETTSDVNRPNNVNRANVVNGTKQILVRSSMGRIVVDWLQLWELEKFVDL